MRLFTEIDSVFPEAKLNIEIFSLGGAFQNPLQSGDFLRNIIPKGRFYQNLYGVALQCDKDNIHPELVQWADIILSMHNSALPGQKHQQRWLANNIEKFREQKKKVIWRSIGQSTPEIENELKLYKKSGMSIVRYSPMERLIPNYAGDDAIIRFYKDPEEFGNWNGEKKQVITIAQSFKKRGDHLGYGLFDRITEGFNRKVYGTENADLGEVWGGTRSYEELKKDLRDSRAFWYFGTKPAPYTLSLIEAMLTGVPIIAAGPKLREDEQSPYKWKNYEIPSIISNGINGYVSDSIDELRGYIQLLLENDEVAKRIGEAGRETALELWDKKKIMGQWVEFLSKI